MKLSGRKMAGLQLSLLFIAYHYAAGQEEVGREVMSVNLKKAGFLEERITVTLTKRDLLLLKLCLQVMEREHAPGGSVLFDIKSLQGKLIGPLDT